MLPFTQNQDGDRSGNSRRFTTIHDVEHLRCRSGATPRDSLQPLFAGKAQMSGSVAQGAVMPPVEGCHKQTSVLFIIGVAVEGS